MSASVQSFAGGELVKMVTGKWTPRVVAGLQSAIAQSFVTDSVLRPVQTRAEIERRFQICIRWFVTLRRDLGWSVPRILDELPIALRIELEGGRYEPDQERPSWLADVPIRAEIDGADMAPETPAVEGAIEVNLAAQDRFCDAGAEPEDPR